MRKAFIFFLFFIELGCGVKGDPVPPEVPAELGRGRPTYRRATEGVQLKELKDVQREEDELKEQDEEEF